jgi:hypothetical protein
MSEGQSRAERLVLQDQARLLNRLILEERRGWPELPEPPAGPPVPLADKVVALERICALLYPLLLEAEMRSMPRIWPLYVPPKHRLSPDAAPFQWRCECCGDRWTHRPSDACSEAA